jgi:hypothetical protein
MYSVLHRIAAIIIFLTPLLCHAQPQWAPVGAKWWYGEEELPAFGQPPYAEYFYNTEVVGQAQIQGKLCSQITASGCTFCDNTNPCYIYEDSNRVYYFSHQMQQFYLLYDFNLTPDEVYLLYFYDFDSLNYIQVYITDTFSVSVNGNQLKAQTADFMLGTYTYSQTLMEVVGAAYNFFPTTTLCDIGFKGLRCYQDSTLGLYHYSLVDCEYSTVGIAEQQQNAVTIYPNPATNTLTIETQTAQGIYQLQDITGKVLLSGSVTANKFSLDISALSKGIYLLSVIDDKQHVNRKIVIE